MFYKLKLLSVKLIEKWEINLSIILQPFTPTCIFLRTTWWPWNDHFLINFISIVNKKSNFFAYHTRTKIRICLDSVWDIILSIINLLIDIAPIDFEYLSVNLIEWYIRSATCRPLHNQTEGYMPKQWPLLIS